MITALMIPVEQAVRPVRAADSVRMRMREELYAHLLDIYTEERSRHESDEIAVARSIARFGRPEELTRQLQGSLTRHERYEAWLGDRINQRPGESATRAAARLALLMALVMLVSTGPICVWKAFDGQRTWPWLGAIALVMQFVVSTFAIAWLSLTCADRVRHSTSGAWRMIAVWMAALATAGVIATTGCLALLAASRARVTLSEAARPWLIMALISIPAFVGVLQSWQNERRRSAAWDALELPAASLGNPA